MADKARSSWTRFGEMSIPMQRSSSGAPESKTSARLVPTDSSDPNHLRGPTKHAKTGRAAKSATTASIGSTSSNPHAPIAIAGGLPCVEPPREAPVSAPLTARSARKLEHHGVRVAGNVREPRTSSSARSALAARSSRVASSRWRSRLEDPRKRRRRGLRGEASSRNRCPVRDGPDHEAP